MQETKALQKQEFNQQHTGGTITFIEETFTALTYADKAIKERGFYKISEHIHVCRSLEEFITALRERTKETFAGVIVDTTRLARIRISDADYQKLIRVLKKIPRKKIKLIYRTDKYQREEDRKLEERLLRKMSFLLEA